MTGLDPEEEATKPYRTSRAVGIVLGATAISATSSFIILLMVAPELGPARYANFSVFWSALFMLIGVLFGVQQESTRVIATSRTSTSRPSSKSSIILFAFGIAAVLVTGITLTGWLWSKPLFGENNGIWLVPLTLGAASYVLVAALNGILAGSANWRYFGFLAVIDGLLRLSLVAGTLYMGGTVTMLVWAVVIPFPISFVATFLLARREVQRHGLVEFPTQQLTANTLRTMFASLSTAVLVNGLPVILAFFSNSDEATLGVVILAVMLTRAPILVPLNALQSMLIARFSSHPPQFAKLLTTTLSLLVICTAVLSAVAGLWGPGLLKIFFGADFVLSGGLLAGLVFASGTLGVLTVTGSATLARGRHNAFASGWMLASAATILFVALTPLELALRTALALIVGPLIGAMLHFWAMKQK